MSQSQLLEPDRIIRPIYNVLGGLLPFIFLMVFISLMILDNLIMLENYPGFFKSWVMSAAAGEI